MKKIWITLIILVIVIIISLIVILLMKKKKIELTKDNIKYMNFTYTTGNAMYSSVNYKIEYKDYKYIATIKPSGKSEEEAKQIEIDENTLEKIVEVLNKYNVYTWNNFHKNNKSVLDGTSFSFNLETKEDKTIDASGYMRWPNNYKNVRDELNTIFNSLYNVKEININNLSHLRFSYSKGYAKDSNIVYEINKIDDKYNAYIKPYGIPEEEAKTIQIDETTINKIGEILNKYNVILWDGFNESDKDVLDGDSFYFFLKASNQKVSASGYMCWPSNYRNVRDELDTLFDNLY